MQVNKITKMLEKTTLIDTRIIPHRLSTRLQYIYKKNYKEEAQREKFYSRRINSELPNVYPNSD